jgi:hypothetical protein
MLALTYIRNPIIVILEKKTLKGGITVPKGGITVPKGGITVLKGGLRF